MSYFNRVLNKILAEDLEKRVGRVVGMVEKLLKRDNRFLKQYMQQEGIENPEGLVRDLAQYDPSGTKALPKGSYIEWIVKILASGQIRLPEDGDKLRKTLTLYDTVKSTIRFKGHKDINAYKNFSELEKLMRQQESQLVLPEEPQNLRAWFKWVERQGVSKFYSDQKYTVLKFDPSDFQRYEGDTSQPTITHGIKVVPKKIMVGDHGQEIEANWFPVWAVDPEEAKGKVKEVTPTALALARLSQGSAWCTANPEVAQTVYLRHGPMYPIFNNGKRYLLADHDWDEFMNDDNQRIVSFGLAFGYFCAKMLRDVGNQLPETAISNIKGLIKRGVEHHEHVYGAVNPRVKELIQSQL